VPPSGIGRAQAVERRQQPVEQRAIFDGELARQPIVVGVVEIELRLEAGKVRRALAKRCERLAQLITLGPVLGVVDHEIVAPGERQRVVQCLRLGAWMQVRHHQNFHIAGQIERARRCDRLFIDGFEDQFDVELRRRVIEAR
jgi:hypothetical protein